MKKLIVIAVFLLVPAGAKAQWTVFDPALFGKAIQEVIQTGQMVTSLQSQASFWQQQIQALINMPARYRAQFANWQNIIKAGSMYGNTGNWNNAVNTGVLGTAYSEATNTLSTYTSGSFATMAADMQQRVKSRVATIQLQDAANPNNMQMIGQVRANGLLADQQLGNLDTDTLDGSLASDTQIAQEQATAAITQAHLQSDANKLMLSEAESLLLKAKQERDEQVAGLTADAVYKANVSTTIQQGSAGLGASMDAANPQ